ncbi:MAG: hypothetical protein M1833_003475 [Piccolia ochrophora]|nr:MAG: hypothetical protein M1833_003475 [Piccolia ochrophora]
MAILPPPYTPRKSSVPSRSRTLTISPPRTRNRSLSVRSKKDSTGGSSSNAGKHRFTMATFRGMQQPELSKKLFRLIKTENHVIGAHETASRERISIASQLSEWGEATGDDALSEISDKLGVLLSELGEQENSFAENLEDSRTVLKQIRNTEGSVQPSREHKAKVSDEIQKLKYKDPTNVKLPQLEQELVRCEAENLVAEAQLTNITRQKLKEAYDLNFAAVIERAERQIILAKHGRRLLNLLDDAPVVPGDTRPAFEHGAEARQVLNDAEEDLRDWRPNLQPITSSAGALEHTLMPAAAGTAATTSVGTPPRTASPPRMGGEVQAPLAGEENIHPAHRKGSSNGSPSRRITSGESGSPPYPVSQTESSTVV